MRRAGRGGRRTIMGRHPRRHRLPLLLLLPRRRLQLVVMQEVQRMVQAGVMQVGEEGEEEEEEEEGRVFRCCRRRCRTQR